MTKHYGIFIGRFQPLHLGHMAVINEIITDGLTPIIIQGMSANGKTDGKKYFINWNYSREQFKYLYDDNINLTLVKDHPSNSMWRFSILKAISEYTDDFNNCVLYYTNHPADRDENGVHYAEWFADLLELKVATYPEKLGIHIRATDIRKDIDANRHWLDGRVYHYVRKFFTTPQLEPSI